MILIKFMLIITFVLVFLQDHKERQVYWFLFPIIGVLGGTLFYLNTLPELFLVSIKINLSFLATLTFIIYLYAKFKLKTKLLSTLGSGDLLLFLAMSFSYSTLSFMVLFISALVFSLLLHLLASKNKKTVTVPLAGYMSLFFLGSYLCHWLGFVNDFYSL